ncbi:hypothetical protein ASG90_17490 [Nocardioides sp. Soil797]|nr:hypothetical protein ASG90_17490 [Nocardioides sp. Soil797]
MSRTLWFAAGAGATVYAMNKARRLRETFTLDGLRDRAHGLAAGARVFRDEVAQGSADKENELRERLGLVPHGTPELESPQGKHRLAAEPSHPPRFTTTTVSGTNQEGNN